jgi:hypothetical protein
MRNKSLFGIVAVMLAVASLVRAENIVTVDGTTYSNARVTSTDGMGIKIIHKAGVAYIPYSELTDADKTKYGYDPKKQEAFFKEQQKQKEAAIQAAKDAEIRKMQEKARLIKIQAEKLAAEEKAKQEEAEKQEQARRDMFKPSGMSVAVFHATKPTTPIVFVAKAKLDDYFNYEFEGDRAKELYWSINLSVPRFERLGNGYILKSGRGEALFSLLQDGKEHAVIVRVRYSPSSEDSSCFYLDDFQETTIKEED